MANMRLRLWAAECNTHSRDTPGNPRLTDTKRFKGDPNAETFELLYPFLPQHFDLLLELVDISRSGSCVDQMQRKRGGSCHPPSHAQVSSRLEQSEDGPDSPTLPGALP